MELIFIRHGQGEHTLNLPSSLHIKNPSLTVKGINQAKLLWKKFFLKNEDIIFISPIRRTLETALIWTNNIDCRKVVSPLVSPRIFPTRTNGKTLPCDEIIDLEIIKRDYPDLELDTNVSSYLWDEGINTLPDSEYNKIAHEFIERLKLLNIHKIYVVSHDGTITAYRQFISGCRLSREDFLDETGWFEIKC
ncbi:histidine phosphatase family protein [Sporosarcina sp. D27]|uniref:histidine phosphatase family protein n=1 Tax=Sporosarcina sp. D27 TaxID=1382305 RepID=UPI000470EA16|nr:histidine phosphatase family protein [Sporosarcina sp. D27]